MRKFVINSQGAWWIFECCIIQYKLDWSEPRIHSESWHSGDTYNASMTSGNDSGIPLSKWSASDDRSNPGDKIAAKNKVLEDLESVKSAMEILREKHASV